MIFGSLNLVKWVRFGVVDAITLELIHRILQNVMGALTYIYYNNFVSIFLCASVGLLTLYLMKQVRFLIVDTMTSELLHIILQSCLGALDFGSASIIL